MSVTNKLNLRANQKEKTQADYPFNPKIVSTDFYGPVNSIAGQTVINLSFSVDQTNKSNFALFIDGKLQSEGSSNDYTFTNIAANNTSSQVTLSLALTAGLNIIAVNRNMVKQIEPTNNSLQSQVSTNLALEQLNYRFNKVYNPEGMLMQRIDPVNGTAVINDRYGADRWKIQTSTSSVNVKRIAPAVTIPGVRWAMQLQKVTNAGFFGQAQWLEVEDTAPLVGQAVTFGLSAYSTGTQVSQIRISVLSWSGTADNPTTNLVSSWSSQPTYIANVTQLGTTTLNLSSAVATGSVTVVVPSGCNNLILFVHTTNSESIGDQMVLSAFTLNMGSTQLPYVRRKPSEEVAICQRYYEKNYELDVPPGTSGQSNSYKSGLSNGGGVMGEPFKVVKVAVPTSALYNPTTGASGTFPTLGSGTISGTISGAGTTGIGFVSAATANSGAYMWTADADF